MDPRGVTFVIDSDMKNVPLVGMSVNRLCRAASFSTLDAFHIELCVVEAVTNSIRHCYGGKTGHEVTVICTLTHREIVLDICDVGPGISPGVLDGAVIQNSPGDVADIEGIPEGGRGLSIIKKIMDSVDYRSEKGKNRLTLRKRLPEKKKGTG
ncbi:MAG: ATP-binding protein [Deltaproteobacteria bacterium]|nr:ATP-binding protein [Deltaproteobacteria bacterium]